MPILLDLTVRSFTSWSQTPFPSLCSLPYSLRLSPDVWTHGDFVSIHPQTRQLFFHGRADGVLNPSGVRFGSSEIYQVLEAEFPNEITDSICVGQRRPQDTDERVMLFLLLKAGASFTPELVARVKAAIRQRLSSRHVPSFIFETAEIPVRTYLDV